MAKPRRARLATLCALTGAGLIGCASEEPAPQEPRLTPPEIMRVLSEGRLPPLQFWAGEEPALPLSPGSVDRRWRVVSEGGASALDETGVPWPRLARFHDGHVRRFLTVADRFGVARNGQPVIVPILRLDYSLAFVRFQGRRWFLLPPELVGLLMHDEPVLYQTEDARVEDHLSRPDVGSETAAKRSLRPSEAEALEALRGGADLVVLDDARGPSFMGSLRASYACLSCHAVPEGALLGAFRYRLAPVSRSAGAAKGRGEEGPRSGSNAARSQREW